MPQPAKHSNNPARAKPAPDRVRPAPGKAKPALDKVSAPDKAIGPNAGVAALAGATLMRVLA